VPAQCRSSIRIAEFGIEKEGIAGMRGTIEERVAYLEGVIENLPSRMDRLEQRMDRLEQRMDRLEQRMDRLEQRMDMLSARIDMVIARMDTHFRWIVISLITIFLAIMALIVNIVFR
jgi:chromosome segregation ATPase